MDFITNLYHFIIFAVCGSALIYDLLYVGDREEPYVYLFYYRGYGGKFKFLTFVCQVSAF